MSSHILRLDVLEMRQRLFHLYHEMFTEVAEKYHLTQMEIDILLFLANNPEYDTASEIVSVRQLTKSHVSGAVEQLVKKGFLARFYEPGNRKKNHLKLLLKAYPAVEDGRSCQREFVRILSAGIDEKELEITAKAVGQMLDNIKRYKGEI